MCPDIAGVFVHLFLHLGQNDGDTFVCEQTVAAGALIDVPEIHIPVRTILVFLADIPEERVCVAASGVCKVIFIFVTFLALGVLLNKCLDLFLLILTLQ